MDNLNKLVKLYCDEDMDNFSILWKYASKNNNFDADIIINQIAKQIYDNDLNKQNKPGYLYCLHNEAYDGWGSNVFKLGMAQNVERRKSSYTTYYLYDSIIKLKSCKLANKKLAENILFSILANYRIRSCREFFDCELDVIDEAMNKVEDIFNKGNENVYVPKIINNIKIELIKTIKDETDIDIINNKTNVLTKEEQIDHNLKYIGAPKENIKNDELLKDIVSNDDIFTGCVKSYPLYCDEDEVNMYVSRNKDIINDNRFTKRLKLLKYIEEYFNIERFHVHDIQLDDNAWHLFVTELKKQENLLPSIINSEIRGKQQINKGLNTKFKNITSSDRVLKFIADLYNKFDNIISYEEKRKQFKINDNETTRIKKYHNFNIDNVVMSYHKKFMEYKKRNI
jgi:hypothetical protein